MANEERRHWFCFSFIGNEAYACVYAGYHSPRPLISKSELSRHQRYVNIGENSVLLAVSYLGYGTKERFDR